MAGGSIIARTARRNEHPCNTVDAPEELAPQVSPDKADESEEQAMETVTAAEYRLIASVGCGE